MTDFQLGDEIEVIDTRYAKFPMRGKIVDLDPHPFKENYAMIEVHGCIAPPDRIFVNLRLAKKLGGSGR